MLFRSPLHARARVQILVLSMRQVVSFIVAMIFIPLFELEGSLSYLIFIIPLCVVLFLCWKFFPETKNKPIGDIMIDLGYTIEDEDEKTSYKILT